MPCGWCAGISASGRSEPDRWSIPAPNRTLSHLSAKIRTQSAHLGSTKEVTTRFQHWIAQSISLPNLHVPTKRQAAFRRIFRLNSSTLQEVLCWTDVYDHLEPFQMPKDGRIIVKKGKPMNAAYQGGCRGSCAPRASGRGSLPCTSLPGGRQPTRP